MIYESEKTEKTIPIETDHADTLPFINNKHSQHLYHFQTKQDYFERDVHAFTHNRGGSTVAPRLGFTASQGLECLYRAKTSTTNINPRSRKKM